MRRSPCSRSVTESLCGDLYSIRKERASLPFVSLQTQIWSALTAFRTHQLLRRCDLGESAVDARTLLVENHIAPIILHAHFRRPTELPAKERPVERLCAVKINSRDLHPADGANLRVIGSVFCVYSGDIWGVVMAVREHLHTFSKTLWSDAISSRPLEPGVRFGIGRGFH